MPKLPPPALSRWHFLWNSGGGLGGIALAWMLVRDRASAMDLVTASARKPHFTPRAKRVV